MRTSLRRPIEASQCCWDAIRTADEGQRAGIAHLVRTQTLDADSGAGGRFVWVEGAGHDIPQTRPEVMREAIEEIWGKATGG